MTLVWFLVGACSKAGLMVSNPCQKWTVWPFGSWTSSYIRNFSRCWILYNGRTSGTWCQLMPNKTNRQRHFAAFAIFQLKEFYMFHPHKFYNSFVPVLFFSVASFHLEKAGAHLTAAFCGLLGFMVLATCPAAPEKQMQAGWKGWSKFEGQVARKFLFLSYCLGAVVVFVGCLYDDHVLSQGSELLCLFQKQSFYLALETIRHTMQLFAMFYMCIT